MKKTTPLFLLPIVLVTIASCTGDNKRAKNFNNKTLVDGQALGFIKKASEAGLAEIKASAIAETLSKNPRVVKFAKMMVEDHTEAGKQLADLADNKLVDKVDTISVAHQKTIDSIARLSGQNFDKAYMGMMVKDHTLAVDLFQETTHNKNNAVQQFAKKTLPTIKMHLDSARAIEAGLK
ncbi:DUF4142 domain-containing protein [Mucilaginibacter mali]|uniref:DUF4142 domain-containing protein n=1 Tax=Mucilaginibacter mali TaxID=2740462 RepID=A0A7D4PTS7_9SPHI|nr:DUF4142 domain-containing protein [Mucilaginibacter mali]QKJ29943.1 DUF4142 domain-containing protein [Mucilaginibacter mali]